MLVDQKTEAVVVPLNDSLKAPGKLELANSTYCERAVLEPSTHSTALGSLSEFAVLGVSCQSGMRR
jgi:hypothetical protein